jgi:recombination protein RecA
MPKRKPKKKMSLDASLAAIKKKFGDGSIFTRQDAPVDCVEHSPSGSYFLDRALGGGYAKGRVVEVFGAESSGKTTLTLHAIAEAQKQGGTCAFVDAEHALDLNYAKQLGVDIDTMFTSQPDSGEQALEIVDMLVRTGEVALIVVDSVAALTPQAELEGDMGDAHVGRQARLMGQAMRKLSGIAYETGTTLIFINQLRMKVGVMFGSPDTTPGGNALKFYSSQRLDIRRMGTEKVQDEIVAIRSRVKIAKNKVAPPFRQAEVVIEFGTGINSEIEILEEAIAEGFVTNKGTWFVHNENTLGQGKANAAMAIRRDPELRQKLVGELFPWTIVQDTPDTDPEELSKT